MTDGQRRQAIISLIEAYTEQNTGARAVARRALIDEGIYTKKGKLRVEFGGEGRPRRIRVEPARDIVRPRLSRLRAKNR